MANHKELKGLLKQIGKATLAGPEPAIHAIHRRRARAFPVFTGRQRPKPNPIRMQPPRNHRSRRLF